MVKSRPFHLMPWPQGPSCTASLHCSRPVPWSHVQAVYKAFTAQSCVRWTKGVVGPLEESDCTACMLSYPTRQCIRICKPSRLPSFTARVRSCKYCLLLLSPLAEQQFLTFDDCSFLVEELLKQGKQGPEAFWGGGGCTDLLDQAAPRCRIQAIQALKTGRTREHASEDGVFDKALADSRCAARALGSGPRRARVGSSISMLGGV